MSAARHFVQICHRPGVCHWRDKQGIFFFNFFPFRQLPLDDWMASMVLTAPVPHFWAHASLTAAIWKKAFSWWNCWRFSPFYFFIFETMEEKNSNVGIRWINAASNKGKILNEISRSPSLAGKQLFIGWIFPEKINHFTWIAVAVAPFFIEMSKNRRNRLQVPPVGLD